MVSEDARVALFIDVDNVLINAQNAGLPFNLAWIIDRVRQEGPLMSAKAYADWTSALLRPVLADFRNHAIELIQLATTARPSEHKNTADIQLAVDALEMVLSPLRPRVVVIVGGDRDFVPLVQKLKRYGTRVIAVGVEGSVSPVLAQACDTFIYYDDLVPPAPEEPPTVAPDLAPAFALIRRAVEALIREGREPTGAAVLSMMRQLDATFDLGRFRTSLKDLALGAQDRGYVQVVEQSATDFVLALEPAQNTAALGPAQGFPREREYDFSSPVAALASYRTILQEHRIPLMPWPERWDFLSRIWHLFEERGPRGVSMDEMRHILFDYADNQGLNTARQAIQKLLYSLNFARCFTPDGDRRGYVIQIPEEVHVPLFPAVGLEEARRFLHRSYLNILTRDRRTVLIPEAVFDLLFEGATLDDQQRTKYQGEVMALCGEVQPPNAIAQAFRSAKRQPGG